jgi:hypothetical protein
MPSARHSELMEQTNHIGVDFLLTELRMALTFLGIAESSDSPDSRSRNYDKALEGYRTFLHFLSRVAPTLEEISELQRIQKEVKQRLEQAGYLSET